MCGIMMQQLVAWIDLRGLIVSTTLLPKRFAQDNPANEFFDGPVIFHKACRQKVEQLRVCWQFAHATEVIRRSDYALTEQVKPDTVHHDTCCQRIAGTGDQVCELTSSAAGEIKWVNIPRDYFQVSPRHDGAGS